MSNERSDTQQLDARREGVQRHRSAFETKGSSDSQLIAALANYLSNTREKDHVRRAINDWRHDVVHQGLQPEELLVQFKRLLLGLSDAQQSSDYDVRLADQRDMIVMCIEAYFADTRS